MSNHNKIRYIIFALTFFISLSQFTLNQAFAEVTVLHEFLGDSSDGGKPLDSLVILGDILYGMTYYGGTNDDGIIFSIKTDGSEYTKLHEFENGIAANGATPRGSLILSETTLYGMTYDGGADFSGTIFSIQTDGTGFTIIHSFDFTNGGHPYGNLTLANNTLYGMTRFGGNNSDGTIFSINTNGSAYAVLHSFDTPQGDTPESSVIYSEGILYGMTTGGGSADVGVVFSVEVDGSNYTVLHEFLGGTEDGSEPYGSLLEIGNTLYGMTQYGGNDNKGIFFSIDKDGNNYSLLREFPDATDDASRPYGSFIKDGNTLYALSLHGGEYFLGTLFSIDSSGNNFEILHSFNSTADNGLYPYGTPILDNYTLYGMTNLGGTYNEGIIFSYALPVTPNTITTLKNTFNKDTKCHQTKPPETTWITFETTNIKGISGMNLTWTQYGANTIDILIDDGTGAFPWKLAKTLNDGHEFIPSVATWQNIKIRPHNHCRKGEAGKAISAAIFPNGWYNE